jgi:hypothetical protein
LGECLLRAVFFEILEVAQKFGRLLSSVKSFVVILTKHGFGYIFGNFAHTHLVTLTVSNTAINNKERRAMSQHFFKRD